MSYLNELLVSGYIHYIIEHEFHFQTIIILPSVVNHTILSYLPKAKKLKIPVTMGPCIVSTHANKKYTMYTFKLDINGEMHIFTARYSSLLEFHNSLFKDKKIQKSFGNDLPIFPPKKWWLDFTKPENYSKRAHKLLKYFQMITKHESVLKNNIFQNGIYLPKHLRLIILNTVRGYHWPKLPKPPLPSPTPSPPISISPPPTDWPLTLDDELNNLLKQTDDAMIDVNDRFNVEIIDGINHRSNEWYKDSMDDDTINQLNLFCIQDVLPKCLLNDENHKLNIDESKAMEHINYIKLFEKMSCRENEQIDEIVLDLRDAILESCDITVVN